MRVGFASIDGQSVNEHFGHAKYWEIYDIGEKAEFVDSRMVRSGCNCHDPALFDDMLDTLSDCEALFVSRIGKTAAEYLLSRGVRVFEAAGTIDGISAELISSALLNTPDATI